MANNDGKRDLKVKKCLKIILENLLLILSMIGVILGFIIGFTIRPLDPSPDALLWIGLPGELYLRMLQMMILPLIASSVIAGAASLDPRSNGKISLVTLGYTVAINIFGVMLGAAITFIVNPGRDVVVTSDTEGTLKGAELQTQDLFIDMIRNLVPDNIVTACFQKAQTTYEPRDVLRKINGTNITTTEAVKTIGVSPGSNVLGLILVCSALGMVAGKVGKAAMPFLNFFQATSDIVISLLKWIIWLTPVGAASLISSSVAGVDDLSYMSRNVGMFVLAVAAAVAVLDLVVFPVLYVIVTRRNPLRFLYTSLRPVMVAFAPPASAFAIPEMLATCEYHHGVDRRVSRFCIPVGAALNRNGSAAFIFIAACFLCNLDNRVLETADLLFIGILTAVSSLAIPAIPSGSIVTILIILSSINIGVHRVGIILAFEWITDRLRATPNCMGMIFGAILTDRLCQDVLEKLPDIADVELEIGHSGTESNTADRHIPGETHDIV